VPELVTSEVRCLVTCATANFAYSALTSRGRDVGAAAELLGAFDREIGSDDTNVVDFGAWQ